MANEKVNKVVLGNEVLIDLTSVTVDAGKILQGYTAHDKSGEQVTGTATTEMCTAFVMNQRVDWQIPTTIGTVVGTNLILAERS